MSTEPKNPENQKRWEDVLYAPERIKAVIEGKMTFRELHMISGEEMRSLATTGFQLYEQGRYQDARVVFEGLSVLDPLESYYVSAVGAIYLAEENLPMAMQVLNAAIALNDRDISAHVNRAEVFLRLGKLPDASKDLQRVIAIDPKREDPMTNRAIRLATGVLTGLNQAKEKILAGEKKGSDSKGEKPKSFAAKTAPAKGAPKKRK